MSDYTLMQRVRQAEQSLSLGMSRRQVTQMQALVRVTEAALSQVSTVHRYAVDTARQTLVEAERIQRTAGKPLDDPAFRAATSAYLNRLTYITESAGVDILRVIDTALK